MTAENVVFAFQVPLPKNNMHLTFSRWQQSLIGVLSLDIEYEEEVKIDFKLNSFILKSNIFNSNFIILGLISLVKFIRRSTQLGPNSSLMLDLPTKIEEIKNGISLQNLLFIEA